MSQKGEQSGYCIFSENDWLRVESLHNRRDSRITRKEVLLI